MGWQSFQLLLDSWSAYREGFVIEDGVRGCPIRDYTLGDFFGPWNLTVEVRDRPSVIGQSIELDRDMFLGHTIGSRERWECGHDIKEKYDAECVRGHYQHDLGRFYRSILDEKNRWICTKITNSKKKITNGIRRKC